MPYTAVWILKLRIDGDSEEVSNSIVLFAGSVTLRSQEACFFEFSD